MKKAKYITTLILLLVFASGIHGAKFFIYRKKGITPSPTAAGKTKGSLNAPLHIVEYTDFQCPACAKGADFLGEYFFKYPDKFLVEYRHFPLTQIHPNALKIAVYAECAAKQRKFWPYHDQLFVRRAALAETDDIDGNLKKIAEELKLDSKKLAACVQDEKTADAVLKEKAVGKGLGVSATPTYFVNDKMAVGIKGLTPILEEYFKAGKP